MAKLCELLDEIPELDKRVYALELLAGVDTRDLSDYEFNLWLGLLFDFIDLLSQTACDIRILGKQLEPVIE